MNSKERESGRPDLAIYKRSRGSEPGLSRTV